MVPQQHARKGRKRGDGAGAGGSIPIASFIFRGPQNVPQLDLEVKARVFKRQGLVNWTARTVCLSYLHFSSSLIDIYIYKRRFVPKYTRISISGRCALMLGVLWGSFGASKESPHVWETPLPLRVTQHAVACAGNCTWKEGELALVSVLS